MAGILVKDLGSGWLTGSVGGLNSVVVEDVVHDIILIGTIVAGGWGVGGGWSWLFWPLKGNSLGEVDQEGGDDDQVSIFHSFIDLIPN